MMYAGKWDALGFDECLLFGCGSCQLLSKLDLQTGSLCPGYKQYDFFKPKIMLYCVYSLSV